MDWLKDILGDNLSDENLDKIKKELPKHFALKTDFNARGEEIKNLSAQLEAANQSIKEISAKAETSETLKAELEKISSEYENFKNETTKREQNYQKKDKLKALLSEKFNPDAIDLLVSTFDLDSINLNEAGEIVDGESKLQKLAEAKPGLVIKTTTEGTSPKDKQTDSPQDDYSKMTDEEYYKMVLENKGE